MREKVYKRKKATASKKRELEKKKRSLAAKKGWQTRIKRAQAAARKRKAQPKKRKVVTRKKVARVAKKSARKPRKIVTAKPRKKVTAKPAAVAPKVAPAVLDPRTYFLELREDIFKQGKVPKADHPYDKVAYTDFLRSTGAEISRHAQVFLTEKTIPFVMSRIRQAIREISKWSNEPNWLVVFAFMALGRGKHFVGSNTLILKAKDTQGREEDLQAEGFASTGAHTSKENVLTAAEEVLRGEMNQDNVIPWVEFFTVRNFNFTTAAEQRQLRTERRRMRAPK